MSSFVPSMLPIAPLWLALGFVPVASAGQPNTEQSVQQQRIDDLIRQLGSDQIGKREEAMKELVAVGAPALKALSRALGSSDPEIARRAMQCIPLIQDNIQVAALIAALDDPSADTRTKAANALMEMGKKAEAAVPRLMKALATDGDSRVRERAAVAFGFLGPKAQVAVPTMIATLKDKQASDNLRMAIAITLARIGGPEAEKGAPILLVMLQSDNWQPRAIAAFALGSLGPKQEGVVDALLKALNDDHESVQGNAASALGLLGREPDRCVPRLTKALHSLKDYSGKNDPRNGILGGLGKFGEKAAQAVPAICEIAADEKADTFTRSIAIRTLGDIGPAAHAAVPCLKSILTDAHPRILAEQAAAALTKITKE